MRIAFTLGLLLLLSVAVNSQQRISHDWIVGYTHMDTYPRSIYSSSSPAGWPDTDSRSLFFFYRFGANLNIHLTKSCAVKTGMRFINSGQLISSDWYSDNGQDAEGNIFLNFKGGSNGIIN
ncbi:hypothetical protein [Sanyastnella coralliicola]|uniref:hypothetical protein n=1 Tax=Sanyastnella coralliicola TaxID=3069118 RepID=UPI0027B927F5|nr:hypothetical protein [Longitalea sp. SCSIO 12813]